MKRPVDSDLNTPFRNLQHQPRRPWRPGVHELPSSTNAVSLIYPQAQEWVGRRGSENARITPGRADGLEIEHQQLSNIQSSLDTASEECAKRNATLQHVPRINWNQIIHPEEVAAIEDIEVTLVVDKHVAQLSIKQSGHFSSLPNSIRKLKNLTYLGLQDNSLTTLPDVFDDLPLLMVVDLTGNRMRCLPSSLRNMNHPIQLKLSVKSADMESASLRICRKSFLDSEELSAIEDIEAVIGKQLELTTICCASCSNSGMKVVNKHVTQLSIKNLRELSCLPDSIRKLKNLTFLDLSGNGLTMLPNVFYDLRLLKTIDLTGNPMRILPFTLRNMIRPIQLKKDVPCFSESLALKKQKCSDNSLSILQDHT